MGGIWGSGGITVAILNLGIKFTGGGQHQAATAFPQRKKRFDTH